MFKKSLTTLALSLVLSVYAQSSMAAPVKNIVLVHGAFVDGSGWDPVARILNKAGYNVSIVQEPQTSLADDVAATRRVLALQSGKSLLVGHSYAGMIISDAGNDPSVAGLVYIAAFQPEQGDSLLSLAKKYPPAAQSITETPDHFLYIKPENFHADFAADLPVKETNLLAQSQLMPAVAAFTAPAGVPAWKTKPSWAVVATQDRAINPELERFMAKRAHSTVTELKGNHAIYASQPEKIAAVIEKAAQSLSQ
ncbi:MULTISPECIES: alpha/beta fold hydrolase [Rahnella]|jgi:pimeloyl-ACP methyl ester carboxylesterase|uniref:Alpha/beta hydrolase n=1 Tax=Rahnella victoriana TaxID=1510570 RepID=A0ABS0DPG7_9GAMM|nr:MULTISPECIES: alpha/beta hydrolase [Rahnella]VTQ54501.1 Alpha/beta hydrolase family [Campylobacter jejuni]MBF7955273.1 alpha/beta hydrolase [Rahnella victoriana]TBX34874.1 alpha/beta hydrolase [Rahnella victoriana]TDS89464.1 pimeloyl-ACP methyl ester carboxylesterase [Rahnella sp. BIGb0236]UHM90634.1 alpha/beta hydrolase [Rahnella victoriana]